MNTVLHRVLAVLEILGGTLGIALFVVQFSRNPLTAGNLLVGALLCVLSLNALLAGALLWRGNRVGWVLSILTQVAQLPKVLSPYFVFGVSFGLDFAAIAVLRPEPARFGFDTRFGAHSQFFVNPGAVPTAFGLSVVSCFWLIFLLGFYRAPIKERPAELPDNDVTADDTPVDAFLKSRKAIQRAKEQI
ncbi:unnamed protein product [Gemmata massiliana]|uniref:Uncharacterized protein n=1 Tax=Gemmata massiliana TaxID=1210884 RepID=A0A6P2CWH7_9BACT|nr:hypothetical protein [Gemmata massiliana]VTR93253.1 unnamed protein product [Gemmata massiliana]